jgi:hypothetical protein
MVIAPLGSTQSRPGDSSSKRPRDRSPQNAIYWNTIAVANREVIASHNQKTVMCQMCGETDWN